MDTTIVKPKYICIGSIARVGKDLLAKAISHHLTCLFHNVEIVSLSLPIKLACSSFIKEAFNLDVFTNDSLEKEIFRPVLVTYGNYHRKKTKGKFFCEMFDQQVQELLKKKYNKKCNLHYVICPDLRYSEYEQNDEIDFFRSKNALIINLDRINTEGRFIEPANDSERVNSQKIRQLSDLNLQWNTFKNPNQESIEYTKRLVPFILNFFTETHHYESSNRDICIK